MPRVLGAWSKSAASIMMCKVFSKARAKSAMEVAEREARAKSTMRPPAKASSKAKCRPLALLRGKARAKAKPKVPTITSVQIDTKEAFAKAKPEAQAPTTTNIQIGRAQALAKARAKANNRIERAQAPRVIGAPARAQEWAPEEAKPISKARRGIGASHWGHEGGERRKQHTFKVYVPTANSMPGSSSGS